MKKIKIVSMLILVLFLCCSVALSLAEAACVQPPSGLVSWWPGDGSATDVVGSKNGSLQNGAAFATGLLGRAFSLDGIDDYMLIGDPIPGALQLQGSVTLEAWIYVSQYPTDGNGLLGLIVGSQYDDTRSGVAIHLDGRTNPDDTSGVPAGHIHFQMGDGSWHAVNSQTPVPLNQWVHIVATRNANEDGRIYYNGVLQPSTSVPWSGALTYNGSWFAIGQQKDLDRHFEGMIDDVRIYNRALTGDEVAAIYNAGSAGMCPHVIDLRQTGQTTSYATGDDGATQRGAAWPNPRFVDNGNGTVTDKLTDLIWLKNASCLGAQPWANALAASNSLANGACGLTDGSTANQWRLPTVNELQSLVNAQQVNTATWLTSGGFGNPFTNVQSSLYWSSTTYAPNTTYAWIVYMIDGFVNAYFKSNTYFVWPVRAGQ